MAAKKKLGELHVHPLFVALGGPRECAAIRGYVAEVTESAVRISMALGDASYFEVAAADILYADTTDDPRAAVTVYVDRDAKLRHVKVTSTTAAMPLGDQGQPCNCSPDIVPMMGRRRIDMNSMSAECSALLDRYKRVRREYDRRLARGEGAKDLLGELNDIITQYKLAECEWLTIV